MSIDKKCPHCGEWTVWNNKLNDRCTHCSELLDQRRIKEVELHHEREREHKANDLYAIRETDGPFMIVWRRIMLVFHIIFGGIAWIFIWMFASTPG